MKIVEKRKTKIKITENNFFVAMYFPNEAFEFFKLIKAVL